MINFDFGVSQSVTNHVPLEVVISRYQENREGQGQPDKPWNVHEFDQVQTDRQENCADDGHCVTKLYEEHRRPGGEDNALNFIVVVISGRRCGRLPCDPGFFDVADWRPALIAKLAVGVQLRAAINTSHFFRVPLLSLYVVISLKDAENLRFIIQEAQDVPNKNGRHVPLNRSPDRYKKLFVCYWLMSCSRPSGNLTVETVRSYSARGIGCCACNPATCWLLRVRAYKAEFGS